MVWLLEFEMLFQVQLIVYGLDDEITDVLAYAVVFNQEVNNLFALIRMDEGLLL